MLRKITFYSGSLKLGGPQRVMVALSNIFVENGIEVKFVTTVSNEVEYDLNPKIKHIKVPSTSNFKVFKTIQKLLWMRKTLKEDDSDIVISFWHNVNMYLMVSSLFLNKKILISERNDPNNEPENYFLRKVRDFLYRFANFIVFQTEEARDYYPNKIKNKSAIIPNPINESLPERFDGKRKKEIVNYCRLVPQKNLFMLINAFSLFYKEHSDYSLTIYGRGPLKSELIKHIENLGLEKVISIKDYEKNIHAKVRESAMFVSSSDYEGISNSMLEAMAIGLPTICTDCPIGGARMTISSYENGILVPVGDEVSLYKAMNYIANNPEKAEKISKSGTKIRQELTIENLYLKWDEILKTLL